MENVCDYKARKVCCCDFLKQVPTDQLRNKKKPGELLEIQTEFKSRIYNMDLHILVICALTKGHLISEQICEDKDFPKSQ